MEFSQEEITTLHDLSNPSPSVSLDEVGVVVPLAASDLNRVSLDHTLSVLSELAPEEVIIALRGTNRDARRMRSRLTNYPVNTHLLWCNSPAIVQQLADANIPQISGKGIDVWLALALAGESHDIVVLHDADNEAYQDTHVPRLVWPLQNGFGFAKGYYARVEQNRLYGRLTRLCWAPLIRVLQQEHPGAFVRFLGAFRYALAGEIAVTGTQAQSIQVPPGWGVEIAMLGHAFEHLGKTGVAQVDLGNHHHSHRAITGAGGLDSMARDMVGTLLTILAQQGIELEGDQLADRYETIAEQLRAQYAAESTFNGLVYDPLDEREQIRHYCQSIESAEPVSMLPPFSSTDLDPTSLRTSIESGELEIEQVR